MPQNVHQMYPEVCQMFLKVPQIPPGPPKVHQIFLSLTDVEMSLYVPLDINQSLPDSPRSPKVSKCLSNVPESLPNAPQSIPMPPI